MSLALAMSTNLNRDLCSNMAVSSNIQAVSNTPTVHQQKPFHVHDGEHCCGLPYQDHNYGAPPPPPTPPRSPSEPCFKPVISHESMCISPCLPVVSPPPSVLLHKPYQNGLAKEHRNSENGPLLLPNNIPEAGLDITRCICGFTHDDGYMICCDNCSVWQHIDCMKIDRNNIPDTYLCDRCNPRPVNQQEAVALQSKKREDLLTSDLDSSGVDSCDERTGLQAQGRIQYKSVQSTPTSLTITSNRNFKRQLSTNGSTKKRKRSKEDSRRGAKKLHSVEKKQTPRGRSKSTCQDAGSEVDILSYGLSWEKKLREWSESYHELDKNHYSPELLQAVLSASNKLNNKDQAESILSRLQTQLNKVQQLKHKLMAIEDISMSAPLVEVKGVYMLSNQFEGSNSAIEKRPYPYVFFYNGFDGLQICIDARESGNAARYVRRSCQPNSELKHTIENNQLRLYVHTRHSIAGGSEITIPFDFNYKNIFYNVECACSSPSSCPVHKFSGINQDLVHRNGLSMDGRKLSPLVLSLSKVNGYTSSDHEHAEADDGKIENLRKKSREERKMEAYIRAFEKMEKQSKKKELNHHHHHNHQHQQAILKSDAVTNSNNSIKSPTQATPIEVPIDMNLSHNITPVRRINRRRSTRGRRNSRRGRGPSFEGVMSPGVAMETDSNHSFDESVAPASAERFTSVDSGQSLTSSGNLCSDMADDSTQFSLLGNEVASILDNMSSNSEEAAKKSKDLQTSEWLETTQNSTVQPVVTSSLQDNVENVATVSQETRTVSSAAASCVSADAPVTTTSNSIVTVAVTKPNKSKKSTSTDGAASAVLSFNSSRVGTPTTSLTDSKPICSFIPWEFRPGVPSGHVRISIDAESDSFLPRKRADKFVKKHWLEKAQRDNLLTNDESSVSVPAEVKTQEQPAAVHFFKKKILKEYSQSQDLNSEKPQETEVEKAPSSLEEPEANNSLTDSTNGLPTAEDKHQDNADPTVTTPPPNVANNKLLHPALEYEKLSDDDEETDACRSDACVKANSSSGEDHQVYNNNLSPLVHSWLAAERSRYGEQVFLPPSSSLVEDAQAVPAKKKVSLQEYLKRSKDVRKCSPDPVSSKTATSTTASKPSITTTTTTTTTVTATTIASSSIKKPISPLAATSTITQPTTLTNSSIETQSKPNGQKDIDDLSRILTEAAKSVASGSSSSGQSNQERLNNLSSALSTGNIKTLPPEVMEIITNTVKQLKPGAEEKNSTDTSRKDKPSSGGGNTNGPSQKGVEKSSPASLGSPVLPTAPQRHVPLSRSMSTNSPSIAPHKVNPPKFHSHHRDRSGSSGDLQRKQGHHPVLSKAQSAHSSPASTPRSPRAGHPSSLQSPSTPTMYEHRRTELSTNKRGDVGLGSNNARSRHNSGTSSGSNSTLSTRSPHTEHFASKHASGPPAAPSNPHRPDLHHRGSGPIPPPQKVQSICPAVPGQPIPSLARGPGGSGPPQAVYNSRPTRPLNSPPPWDDFSHGSRPPKDNYNRSYYPPLPEHVGGVYRRPSYEKPHYDRHPPYPGRRDDIRDDYPLPPPSKLSPPHSYYHHNSYYPGPSHSDGKNPYFGREAPPPRPLSPGPPPIRHGPPDYYKRKGEPPYRPNYYNPDMHRR